MINFYEQNPPSQSSKDSLREDRAQILAKLKEVSAERTRLQIALKTINAELFLRNKAKGKVLVNAILPSEVNSEWRDFVEKHSPKQQSDIFRELVLNYSSAVTVDELVKMDEEEANAKIVANAKKKKLKPIRK